MGEAGGRTLTAAAGTADLMLAAAAAAAIAADLGLTTGEEGDMVGQGEALQPLELLARQWVPSWGKRSVHCEANPRERENWSEAADMEGDTGAEVWDMEVAGLGVGVGDMEAAGLGDHPVCREWGTTIPPRFVFVVCVLIVKCV